MTSIVDELAEFTLHQLRTHRKAWRLPHSDRPPRILVLKTILTVLFYSSLKTEEGQSIQARVFYLNPNHPDATGSRPRPRDSWRFCKLDIHIPFTAANLAKFAKAADPWTTGVAIFHDSHEKLFIWGILDQVVHFSMGVVHEGTGGYLLPGAFHVLVNGPADLTVMVQNDFVARLTHDVLIRHENNCLYRGPINRMVVDWMWSTFNNIVAEADACGIHRDRHRWQPFLYDGWVETVSRILINTQRQRHGGALIVTPDPEVPELTMKYKMDYSRIHDGLRATVLQTILAYTLHDDLFVAKDQEREELPTSFVLELQKRDKDLQASKQMLTGAIRCVSSFTGVDGAVVLDPVLRVRGFGSVITTQEPVKEVLLLTSGTTRKRTKISTERFGTRHGSMFRYCFKHAGTLGFVVSQDGNIRAVTRLGDDCVMFDNVRVHYFEN